MAGNAYPSSALITLSSRTAPWLPFTALSAVAAEVGLAAIDLDLTAGWARWRPSSRATDPPPGRVAALWLPYGAAGHSIGQWERVVPTIRHAMAYRPERVVVGMAPGPSLARAELAGLSQAMRSVVGEAIAVTVLLPTSSLVGGRSHLAQMTMVRRLAAEWDFDLALDLSGRVDPRWEAEAAIVRLGPRLRLVRIGGSALLGGWSPGARVVTRAMTAMLHSGHASVLSIVPSVPPWRQLSPNSVALVTHATLELVERRRATLTAPWHTGAAEESPRWSLWGERG